MTTSAQGRNQSAQATSMMSVDSFLNPDVAYEAQETPVLDAAEHHVADTSVLVAFPAEVPKHTWEPNSAMCSICKSLFGLRPRHHCRGCGKCVCENCSPNRLESGVNSEELLRFCSVCIADTRLRQKELLSSLMEEIDLRERAEAREEELRVLNRRLREQLLRLGQAEKTVNMPDLMQEDTAKASVLVRAKPVDAAPPLLPSSEQQKRAPKLVITEKTPRTGITRTLLEKGKQSRGADVSDWYKPFDGIRGLLVIGRETRGATAHDSYRFGDLTRSIFY